MPLSLLLTLSLVPAWTAPAKTAAWTVAATDTTANFRAVSAGGGKVCWASGSKGTFARTLDGKTWKTGQVKGAETAEFRSIVAFGRDSAVMLAIGDGAASQVWRTDDGGKSWTRTFRNPDARVFYDALAFWDRDHGLAFGDPVDNRIPILATEDGGRTWSRLDSDIPPAEAGEAAFAASGRCLALAGSSDAWIVTGGGAARVFRSRDRGRSWTVAPTPLVPLTGSSGLFGVLPIGREAFAVGGDYESDDEPGYLLASRDDGRTWPLVYRPAGLREAAIRVLGGFLLVGSSGTDLSTDGGKTWRAIPNPGALHTAALAGGTVWAVGEKGLIARLSG